MKQVDGSHCPGQISPSKLPILQNSKLDYKQNDYAALVGLAVLAAFVLIYFIFHKKQGVVKDAEQI